MKSKAKNLAPVTVQQTVSDAFRDVLTHNLGLLAAWEEAARIGDDIEGVHQLRVAFRRLRSALRVFRAAVPRAATQAWADEMRWLANQLGPARDLDVFIDEGLHALSGKLPLPGEEKLAELTQRHREQAYQPVREMLASNRYGAFKQNFSGWLETEGWLNEELTDQHRQRLEKPVVPFARRLLTRQRRKVVATGEEIDQNVPEQMHLLRIACKRLRYAAEFFRPLFEDMDVFIDHLKQLQDLLGVMNDVAVMHQLLETLLTGETDPETLQYAGALVGWRTRQYYEIKNSFNERWAEFIEAEQPWRG